MGTGLNNHSETLDSIVHGMAPADVLSSDDISQGFHALSEPIRIHILERLRHQELCVAELCEVLDISQSKLSFHLRVLKEANLVHTRHEGRWTYYSLNLPRFNLLEQYLAEYCHN